MERATSPQRGPSSVPFAHLWLQAWQYQIDCWQRSLLFLDTLRERANTLLEHEKASLPPVLAFKYEIILDARTFERPANYALVRIIPPPDLECQELGKRPVIILDPRAGHGPGIVGSKRDSEVGMALLEGHPVYFVIFFPEPSSGQTLADGHYALHRFIEEVGKRHPGQGAPVLYGNCQAGWAVALLSADCEGLVGPAVLNGSPLSYWAGEPGVNTMRVLGGLVGGAWLAHLLADLGDGTFDGAWLVQNFETLNPAQALWDKYVHLFQHPDEERERFLDFERWWNGFYHFSREEILAILENLFIGNRPERGEMRIDERCSVDFRRIRNPLLIFASYGDLITPPHQALNWIPAVYGSTEALQAAGQRIVYLINPHVGHLGIFVSARVARFEHRAILEHVEELEALPPGLYEMRILNPTGDPDCRRPQYSVVFEKRRVEDLRFNYPQEAFERARRVSEGNEAFYRTFVSPWIRAFTTSGSATLLRWLHPMRVRCYSFSEQLNPWMAGIAAWAELVRRNRQPVAADNLFFRMEKEVSQAISRTLDIFRKLRDHLYEVMFRTLYG